MAPFRLELEKLPSSTETLTIYKATGKLSLETVNEFIQKLRPETAAGVVLDMSGDTFLDSAGGGSGAGYERSYFSGFGGGGVAGVNICEPAQSWQDICPGVIATTEHGGG